MGWGWVSKRDVQAAVFLKGCNKIMSNRRQKKDDETEDEEKKTSVRRAHTIYFYHPSLEQKPCYYKSEKNKPHYHNDRIFVMLNKDFQNAKHMHPEAQLYHTYFSLYKTTISINWTLKDRLSTRKHSIRFIQRPCNCNNKCCRGKNKKEIRLPIIENVLTFDDKVLYYKGDPTDIEKGSIYRFNMEIRRFHRKIIDYELFTNTNNIVKFGRYTKVHRNGIYVYEYVTPF